MFKNDVEISEDLEALLLKHGILFDSIKMGDEPNQIYFDDTTTPWITMIDFCCEQIAVESEIGITWEQKRNVIKFLADRIKTLTDEFYGFDRLG